MTNRITPLGRWISALQIGRVDVWLHSPSLGEETTVECQKPGLFIVQRGDWILTSNEHEHRETLSPGDVVLVISGGLTRWCCPENSEGRILAIPCTSDANPSEDELHAVPWIVLPGYPGDGRSGNRFAEAAEPLPPTQLVQILVQTLASLLLRSITPEPEAAGEVPLDAEVSQVLWTMQKFPEKPWTLERLANEVSLSRSVLAEKFKEQTGHTPMQSLQEIRMQAASKLLQDRSRSLKEVAKQSGYRSVSAFSTAFKRWAGRSPSEARDDLLQPPT